MRKHIGHIAFAKLERAIAMKQIFRLLRKTDNKKKTAISALLSVGAKPLPELNFFNFRTLQKYLEKQTTYILRNTWETLSRTV